MIALNILLADSRSLALPETLAATLSASSQTRLAQISADKRRQQFLLGRWLMSHAAGCELAMIKEGTSYPVFADEPDRHASISHSGPYVAVVVSKGARCGLDIEYPVRQRNWHALAERAFSLEETTWIKAGAPEEQMARFYRIWTLREAAFKAGLLSTVVGMASVFDPVHEWSSSSLRWQYLQHGSLHISAVAATAFDITVHEIAMPMDE